MNSPLKVFGKQFDASVFVHGSGGGFIDGYQGIALFPINGGDSLDRVF